MRKLFLLMLLLGFSAHAIEPFTVSDIRIIGADRISHGTIFSYLPIKRGDTVNTEMVRASVRRVFGTGYFEDVKLAKDGDVLIVRVVERPAIATISITGNKSIKTEELMSGLSNIGLAEGEVYNSLELDRVKNELTRQFFSRGKYNVEIKTRVRDLDRNRVMVVITIDEGKSAKIKHIKVVGNTIFSDEELIEAFESDTSNWLSWYSQDDQYSKEKLNGDIEKLKSYYMDRGYINTDVESVQVTISQDKKDIYITANIQEGALHTFGKQEITGELIFDKDIMMSYLMTKEGEHFAQNMVEYSAERLKSVLANRGYAFAEVQPVPQINEDDQTVDMTYYVNPGKKVYVRRVNFIGNVKTKDEVLRREMRQFEGAWFSQALIDRSKLRLQQKPYFENVEIETPQVPGTDDQVDVNVNVEERNSGQFTFGVGYSQLSGLNLSGSVSLQNLLGSGNTVSVAVNTSNYYKRLNLFYQDPYFTDDGISLGYSLNYSNINQGEANIAHFNSTNGSLGVQASFPISEFDRIFTNLSYERVALRANNGNSASAIIDGLVDLGGYVYNCPSIITRPEDDADLPPLTEQCHNGVLPPYSGTEENPEFIKVPYQYRRAFSLYKAEARWARDSRNRFFNPTAGSYHSIGIEAALPSSTAEFYKINVKENILFPLNDTFTLSLKGELGYGDGYGDTNGLPFFEHFFTGGVNSVRGYDDNTLGPKSTINDDFFNDPNLPATSREGDAVGGSFKVVGSAELIFPPPFAKDSNAARLAWFVDVGNVFEDFDAFEARELRMSTGVALKWQAPMGPIVISYAYPFNTDRFDNTERLQFTFGNTF